MNPSYDYCALNCIDGQKVEVSNIIIGACILYFNLVSFINNINSTMFVTKTKITPITPLLP